jgi:hypothetical protein
MSRSKRKPWLKDYGRRSKPKIKRIQNRRYRHYVRMVVKPWGLRYWEHTDERYCGFCECWEENKGYYMKQPEEPAFADPHKFSNKYDVIDYRCYCDSPEHRRK